MTDDHPRPCPDGLSTDGRSKRGSTTLSILLIDDNPHVAESVDVAVRLAGHALDRADSPQAGLSRLADRRYDAILLDINYAAGRTNGEEGLALLARIIADNPGARVIVITAHSGIRIAVEAMRGGACDFVMKSWRNADLLAKLERAAAAVAVPVGQRAEPVTARLIGESKAMVRVRDLIRRVGPTMAGVLVTGAPGTGRSLVAAAIHAASRQASQPMIRIDLRDPAAWCRIDTQGGTLILRYPDRLGEVDQARLLYRLPDAVRIIAIAEDASAISAALARRVAAVEVPVPSLAARGDDTRLLAHHFIREAAERHGRPVPRLTPTAEAAVIRTQWPDQVRGLAAAIERAVLLGKGDLVDAASLLPAAPSCTAEVDSAGSPRFDLERNERAVVAAALREHHHNVTHAATALGLSRGALYRRMERYGL